MEVFCERLSVGSYWFHASLHLQWFRFHLVAASRSASHTFIRWRRRLDVGRRQFQAAVSPLNIPNGLAYIRRLSFMSKTFDYVRDFHLVLVLFALVLFLVVLFLFHFSIPICSLHFHLYPILSFCKLSSALSSLQNLCTNFPLCSLFIKTIYHASPYLMQVGFSVFCKLFSVQKKYYNYMTNFNSTTNFKF